MNLKLPKYTSKDNYVMLIVMPPLVILLNSILFGKLYFSNIKVFLFASFITGIACCLDFVICGFIGMALRNRFPSEEQIAKRLTLMIITFIVLTELFLYTLFRAYDAVHFFGYTFDEAGLVWSCVAMNLLNIFITLVMEGIARYEKWQINLKETDSLRASFRQSRLQGLKSQVNPHFLFNSLNSLSSLISEDEAEAEKFLNEMSKVYRYMLRNDEDQLVPLQTELAFIGSYVYLLKARYGEGLNVLIEIDDSQRDKLIAPLTLQMIIENAIQQNAINKSKPLEICISTDENESLTVKNNIQPKIALQTTDHEAGIDNLINKYKLLNASDVIITENKNYRIIKLQLITKNEEVLS
jgi:two-component system LytT family sensor kinase